MTSAKFLDFSTPYPLVCILNQIYITKPSQPPLLGPLFHDPPPPSDADIIFGHFLGVSSRYSSHKSAFLAIFLIVKDSHGFCVRFSRATLSN